MRSIIACCLCFVFFVKDSTGELSLIGAEDTKIENHPYLVSLRKNGTHFCGGSIITESHILTAAHCVFKLKPSDYSSLSVFSGTNLSTSTAGDEHRFRAIHRHQDYHGAETNHFHDIAVVTIDGKIRFNEHQRKIDLPREDYARRGVRGVVSGWGQTTYPDGRDSLVVKSIDQEIIPSDECMKFFHGPQVSERGLCGLKKLGVGICLGDSGGPMAVGNEVVGIVSWIVPCARGKPDVFTHVYVYKDWIKNIIDN